MPVSNFRFDSRVVGGREIVWQGTVLGGGMSEGEMSRGGSSYTR